MGSIAKYRKKKVAMLTAAVMAAVWMPTAMAADTDLPTGGEAVKNRPGLSDVTIREDKDVTIRRNNEDVIGNRMNVTLLGQKGIIDWKTFNIGNKAEVNFLQGENKTGWMILNRVAKGNPSEIYGNLNGHGGTLFLVNTSGITFHEGASVDVGSLVASTLDIDKQNFIDGNYTFFEGENPGKIRNLADIKAADDGVVVLLAHQVFNGKEGVPATGEVSVEEAEKLVANKGGKITAGQVALVAGKNVTLNKLGNNKVLKETAEDGKVVVKYDDKIGVVINAEDNDRAMVLNGGDITAKQGYVLMQSQEARNLTNYIVCNTGEVRANHMIFDGEGNAILDDGEGGLIKLKGGNVNSAGKLDASGDHGGNVEITGNTTILADVNANGTKGKGGAITISGGDMALITETANLPANLTADGTQGGDIKIKSDKVAAIGDADLLNQNVKIQDVAVGKISANGSEGKGGKIDIDSNMVGVVANVSANGKEGGDIKIQGETMAVVGYEVLAEGSINEADATHVGSVSANGTDGKGGTVIIKTSSQIAQIDVYAKTVSADGKDGGEIKFEGNQIGLVNSNVTANGIAGNGGTISSQGGTGLRGGKLEANGTGGKGGTVDLTGDRLVIAGSISADGKDGGIINTVAKNNLMVYEDIKGFDKNEANKKTYEYEAKADVHAAADKGTAGTWNLSAAHVVVGNASYDQATQQSTAANDDLNNYLVSNVVIGKALSDTNVNITATPVDPAFYSDVRINAPIDKGAGADTKLTITAGRNISVNADINKDIARNAGKLDIELNADNQKNTNSERIDGAVIIKSDIDTNGGSFTTTGDLGTYIGLKEDEKAGTERKITTKGGDITLNGAQVLVATGGKVTLDTTNGGVDAKGNNRDGKVTIAGKVDSANAYKNGRNEKGTSWKEANEKANDPEKNTHLAVITSGLEDAVVSAAVPATFKAGGAAYVGGHVVAVETENGVIKYVNGLPVVQKDEDGNIVTISTETTNTNTDDEHIDGGWYVASRDEDGKATSYVRYWAWTAGEEKGTIFYVQTKGQTVKNQQPVEGKENGYAPEGVYANWAPNEPNGQKGDIDTSLGVNYDTYRGSAEVGKVFYSQWVDMSDNYHNDRVKNYIVETELGHTALNINAGETTVNDAVGSLTKLDNLHIDSSANINLNSSVQVDKNVETKSAINTTIVGATEAGGLVDMTAGHNITTGAVTAEKTVSMDARNDVTIKGVINGKAKGVENAVDIRAQKRFLNEAADSAKAIQVGTGSHWKVYSETPYADNFGSGVGKSSALDLNSGNFAIWGWDGKKSTDETGNRYIFKYNPTLTYTAKDASKKYGTAISNTGYTFRNELSGKFLNAFSDGHDNLFQKRLDGAKVGTDSEGYPASAKVGEYAIDMTNADAAKKWGYKVVENPGTLLVFDDTPDTPDTPDTLKKYKPQLDNVEPSKLDGTASYTTNMEPGPSADRVLGLQTAELPFFNERNGAVKLYGTYDVSVDPEKVTMEPTAKVLPEPDQPKNQYREYEKELVTEDGSAKFRLTYNGSTLDIYPTDAASKALLLAGDAKKNVELESKAMFEAFTHMGISLDDLDGVYTHFEEMQVRSFRR